MLDPDDIARVAAFAEQEERTGHPASACVVYRVLYEETRHFVHLICAARNARSARELAVAGRLADLLLQEFGSLHQPCMEAGFCKLEAGAHAESYAAFHAAYRSEQKADAAAWCGVALRRGGNRSAASDYYRLALRLDANQPTAALELASCLDEDGAFLPALELYRHCLAARLSADRTFIYNRVGVCCERAGRMDLLAELLQDPDYYQNLDADYAPESTLMWSLKLRKGIDDEAVLAQLRRRLPVPDGCAEALSLYLQTNPAPALLDAYRAVLASSSYGSDAEWLLREYPASNAHEALSRVPFVAEDEAIRALCDSIRVARPFSLIRLGDGEGNVLGWLMEPQSAFLRRQAEMILRNWFGTAALPPSEYGPLFADFEEAIRAADLLGVPLPARLDYELRNEPRGYWGVYFAALYSCVNAPGIPFVTPVIHLLLFRYPEFIDALRSAQHLNTISCHPGFGPKLRGELRVASGADLLIPGEMGSAALPEQARRGRHYPVEYARVCAQIAQLVPGSIVLIAAGICGKVYAHKAKQAGCVAIDIGAIADFLMGCNTRTIFTDQHFREAHGVAKGLLAA